MLNIIGVQRKIGEFQGKEYDNIMIHCQDDNPSTPTICGNTCEVLKVNILNRIYYNLYICTKERSDFYLYLYAYKRPTRRP